MRGEGREVWLYVGATYALSWAGLYFGADKMLSGPAGLLLMWIPGLVALSFTFATRARFGSLGLGRLGGRFLALSYLIPLAYVAAAYLPVWTTGLGGWLRETSVARIGTELKDTFGLTAL